MSATIASPRNDEHLPVGVAYNCNFIAYRGTSDVVLDGYQEQKGVANALVDLANNSNVKIISMSIGYIFSIDKRCCKIRIFTWKNDNSSVRNLYGLYNMVWSNIPC